MNAKTLRAVVRELARNRGGQAGTDWERVRPLITTVWERMQTDWPRLRSWFESGLTEAEYVRYVTLARRLPNRLSPDERRELLNLTMRGLRMSDRAAADVEGTLAAADEELDAAVAASPVAVAAGDGDTTGFGMTHKIRAEWLDGALGILETTIAPGRLVPAHTHAHEDEVSYVVSGALGFQVGDDVVHAAAGDYVVKPRGVPHAFWNPAAEPARVMEIHAPGRLGDYYDAVRALDDAGLDPAGRARSLAALQSEHGITPHPDLTADLAARHGVTP